MLAPTFIFASAKSFLTKNTGSKTTVAWDTVSSARFYSAPAAPEHEAPKTNPHAEALHREAIQKEFGTLATGRRRSPWKGNWKYLAAIAVVFGGIYYYSVWKVGQDDFSDVDAYGNMREKV